MFRHTACTGPDYEYHPSRRYTTVAGSPDMIANWNAFLASRSSAGLSALIALLVVVVAVADFATGPLLSFSIFYIVPVALASWYAPRPLIVATCLVSTMTWYVVEINSIAYDNTFVPVWNAAVRLAFFAITSALLVALKAALQQQQELAEIDGLTRVLNRRAFEQRCQYLFQLADRQCVPVSVGYLDVDNFKQANDEFGHRMGDRILSGIAATLTQHLREADIVGRLGGDEFAIALLDTGSADANPIMHRILTELRGMAEARGWPVGFSVGVVVCQPPLPDLFDALHHADRLMYDVKLQPADGFLIEEYQPPGSATVARRALAEIAR